MNKKKSSWLEVPLGGIATLRRGITYSSEMLVDDGDGIPYVNMKSFKKGGGFNRNGLKYYGGSYMQDDLVSADDLLIANTDVTLNGDIVGIPAYLPDSIRQGKVLFSHHVTRLRLDSEINSQYLYYLLNIEIYRHWMHKYARGTTVLMLDMSAIKRIPIYYPADNDLQEEIVRRLEVIDRIIEKTENLIQKYQHIKSGLMHDLFSRGVAADGKLRPTKAEAPDLYKETLVGWIPRSWNCSDLCSKAVPGYQYLRTGPFGSALKGEHWVEEGHPVITIGALGEGQFIKSELLFVGEYDAKRLAVFQLKYGDVVFSRVADVGRSVVIKEDQVGWIMSSNLMRISLSKEEVIPEYLQYQLSYDSRIKTQIRCKVNSSGREVANSAILNQLIFVWPSFDEQEEIIRRANAVDERIQMETETFEKLKKQKQGFMHDLLTGTVQVEIDQ
jgi:type I restriction enzyme S subunit